MAWLLPPARKETNKSSAALSFSALADAANATARLYDVFVAELLTETQSHDPNLDVAVKVESASFTWDSPPEAADDKKNKDKKSNKKNSVQPVAADTAAKNEKIFQLKDTNLTIPRGSLCAFVGPVGSGKSSLLQGLIGDMRRTSGSVTFGGSVGYCPQSAWIQVRFHQCHFFFHLHPLIVNVRMPPYARIFALDDHLRKNVTGKPFVMRV